MDTRERILLPLHRAPKPNEPIELAVDVAPLFLHLLLFETVILRSIRLTDVAGLVRALGARQTIWLLDAGCVAIRVGVEHIGSFGAKESSVRLINMYTPDPEQELSQAMDEALGPLGLNLHLKQRLKKSIAARRLTSDPAHAGFGAVAVQETFKEAVANGDTFKRALVRCAETHGNGLTIPDGAIRCELDDGGLRFDASGVRGDAAVVGNVVRRACLAVCRLNEEFGRMQRDDAVTALDDESTALMDKKLEFLWRNQDPERRTGTFGRVLSAVDLPDFEAAVNAKGVNVDRFLKVRETPECREFRAFLNNAEKLDENELKDRAKSLRALIGEAAQTTVGKGLRFLATTGVGVLNPAAGVGASVFDTFLVEKLFPRSGVVTFVGKQYPTIFKEERDPGT